MRVFSDLDFVEQLGSGMHRILSSYSKDIFKISENFLEICFPFEKDYLEYTNVTEQVTEQVKRLKRLYFDKRSLGKWLPSSKVKSISEIKEETETFLNSKSNNLKKTKNDRF